MQKQRKFLWIIVLAAICLLSLVLAACEFDVQPTDEQRYMQVYGMYKAYAEEAGFTPLDYLDWLQSVKGEQGIQGEKGEPGKGISGVTIDENNDVLISYTDGTTQNLGKLFQGVEGAQGPQGEKGDKGDTGAAGADGKDGINGIDGKDGINGQDGADGVGIAKIEKTSTAGNVDTYTITLTNGETITYTVTNGTNGKDGVDGTNGKDGADGAKGDKGDKGDKGEKGDTGAAGADGKDGINGIDGKDGINGQDGADGVSVVSVDSKVEKDENCVYRIVFTYHYSNGTTTQSSVPYLFADGSTLTQHEYSNSWSFDDDYHWHAATCGHGSKDKTAHSWNNCVITSNGKITYTCVCGKTKKEAVAVPTEEGKVTYCFTLADSSPEQGSYASYWIVGDITEWAETPANGALECKNVEGTRIYYIITDAPTRKDDGTYADAFKVTLGYNVSSELSDDKLGVNWDYQSDECYVGLDSQHFTYTVGAQVVDLGTQTFGSKMAAPARVDTTLIVNFAEALPESAKVAIVGGFNSWNADNSWTTIAADRKSASIILFDVLCKTHDYKIKVFTEYEEGKFWNDENDVPYGVEFASYEGKNLSVEITSLDDGGEIILNNTFDKIGWALVLPINGSHSVYIDKNALLTVENVVMDAEQTYSAQWNADTLTYSNASLFVGFGYITEPLKYGMTISLDFVPGVFYAGFTTKAVLEDAANHVWGTGFPGLFVPLYNLYFSPGEVLSRLVESNTKSKGGKKVIRTEGLTTGIDYTLKVVFADTLQWFLNGELVLDEAYDTTDVYYCTLGMSCTISEFGYDKDTAMTSCSIPVTAEAFAGKKITILGDSITCGVGVTETANRYSTLLCTELNAVENNMGVSGTTLCTEVESRSSRLKDIAKIPTDSDYVIIMLGTNDFAFARTDASYAPLGEDGSTDTTTVHGAAEQMCKQLAEMFANNKYHVFIVTPVCYQDDLTNEKVSASGYTLRDFSAVLIAKAQRYGLQYIDLNDECEMTTDDFMDTVHPSDSGAAKMAAVIEKNLLANWTEYTPFVVK